MLVEEQINISDLRESYLKKNKTAILYSKPNFGAKYQNTKQRMFWKNLELED